MRSLAAVMLATLAGTAAAAPPVIGGHDAADGAWPDAVAILFPDGNGGADVQECTGTLVAPTVVLTAGHCYDTGKGSLPDHVLIGTNDLATPSAGTVIAIQRGIQYPNYSANYDVTVLVLATPATQAPRAIADGWAKWDITNGAMVNFVGWGSTDMNGNDYPDQLQEAMSTITDFDCSINATNGCSSGAMPAGELGAGGMGIDTCPGDSGGPMYLPTSYGTFLAGITSRGYNNDQYACSEGGIYERPDKITGWIEQSAGTAITHGPTPSAETALDVMQGGGDNTQLDANDPKSTMHTYSVMTQPTNGTAAVNDQGVLRVCANSDAPTGTDSVTLVATDSTNEMRVVAFTLPITIEAGSASGSCDPSDFSGSDGGGCCSSSRGAGGSVLLAFGVVALVMRKRR
ncbi:MAG TPA: trypsin-like serine protease [Kofleriaceae bacterium]|jgi:endonuclease G